MDNECPIYMKLSVMKLSIKCPNGQTVSALNSLASWIGVRRYEIESTKSYLFCKESVPPIAYLFL